MPSLSRRLTHCRWFRPFRRRGASLLSFGMGLAIACLVLQWAFQLWTSREHAMAEAADSAAGLSASLASRLDATLRPIDACLRSMQERLEGVAPVLDRLLLSTDHGLSRREWLRTGLSQCVETSDELADMAVTDPRGVVIVSAREGPTQALVSAAFAGLRAPEGRIPVFSDVVQASGSGSPRLVASLPVRAEEGRLVAHVVAVIRLDEVARLFAALSPGDGSVIALRRSDDTRLLVREPARPESVNHGVDYRLADELRAGSRRGLFPALRSPVDGTLRLTAYHALERYPFYVAVSRSRAEILSTWLWNSTFDSAATVLLIALLAFGSRSLARRERNFRDLFDTVSDFLFVLDDEGRIVHFNRSARHRLGFATAAPRLLPFADILRQEDEDSPSDILARAAQEPDKAMRCQLLASSGELLPVELRLVGGKWNGLPARFVLCRDISELLAHQKLLEREVARHQLALERTRDGIFLMRVNGDLVEYNSAFRDMLGYTDEQMRQLNVADWDARFSPEELRELVGVKGEDFLLLETRHRRRDGSEIDVEIGACGVEWNGDRFRFGTVRDISARKRAEARLRLYSEAFHHAAEGIAITTPDGTVQEVNDALCEIMGYRRSELIGRNGRMFSVDETDDARFEAIKRDLHRHGFWRDQVLARHRDGKLYPQQATLSVVRDESGVVTHHVLLYSDISSIKENERALQNLAHTDSLTGLPNRSLLALRLEAAMAEARHRGRSLALAYLDLDGFKAVNDNYGHAMGDRLLITMSSRIRSVLRESDVLARLGGDEFVILLPDQGTTPDTRHVLDRVLAEASRPVELEGLTLNVSASIGVSLFPQQAAEDAEALLAQADAAMYLAKRGGKNRMAFSGEAGEEGPGPAQG